MPASPPPRSADLLPHLSPAGRSGPHEDHSGTGKPGTGGRSPTAAAPLLAVGGTSLNSSSDHGPTHGMSGYETQAAGMAAELAHSGSLHYYSLGLSGSSSGAGAGAALALFPTLSSSTNTAGSLTSCGASTSRRPTCAAQLFVEPAATAERKAAVAAAAQAAAATARAELACTLAPLLPHAQRAALTQASMASLAQLTGDVAATADGRALLELLAVASKAARLSPELRAATLPAAVALLSAAAARINPACAERLPLEMRVPRTAALMMHGTAERAWAWAQRACDPPHTANLKEEGRQYLRSLW